MALPALLAAPGAAVIVNSVLAPLLELAGRTSPIIPIRRGRRGFHDAVRNLRARDFEYGVLLTPSFSSALMLRVGGVDVIRGSRTDKRGLLIDDAVPKHRVQGRPRRLVYYELVTRETLPEPPVPVLDVTADLRTAWRQRAELQTRGNAVARKVIGVFPGGNAPSRRWDPPRFAEVVDTLARDATVFVFGGPAEVPITRIVAGQRGIDMGGQTDLPMLAAALAECDILITNDSGPLHLAAAVGTRTLSLWGAGDPAETGVGGAAHTLLRHPELPCVPCVKNVCPRRGEGFVLPEARQECLQLIAIPDVVSAARRMMDQ